MLLSRCNYFCRRHTKLSDLLSCSLKSRRVTTTTRPAIIRSNGSNGILSRYLSSVPAAVRPGNEAAATLGGVSNDGALAELHQRAGLLPRPEVYDERLKPGFRGGWALSIFFLCNAIPFAALLHYLRDQRSTRTELALTSLPTCGADVAAEALRTIRTSAACFLIQAGQGAALHVDPHTPEGTAYVPPAEPLPLVPQLERSDITDIFESPSTPGLGFVHLALSRSSPAALDVLAGDRRASLLYHSSARGAYCTISGQLSVLADPESRRRYWKSQWAFSFPPPLGSDANSVKKDRDNSSSSPPAPYLNNDYLLLRLAISDASVRAVVDGPQRWHEAKARLGDDGWSLVQPSS